jgi:hypothetical protein
VIPIGGEWTTFSSKLMRLLIAFLGLIGLLFAAWACSRSLLPYNDQGRYFDPSEGVVYDSGAVAVGGFFASLFLISAFGLCLYRVVRFRRGQRRSAGLRDE